MNKSELVAPEKKMFDYEESPNYPSLQDEEDHPSVRDKRESSLPDISN